MNSKLLLGLSLFLTTNLFAQLNTTLVSNFQYNQGVSDVWGYVAPDGTEYALVGLQGGVSVINLADPANPVESGFLPGASSTWRDLKTFGEYAYVTNETGQGLMVVDLTDLPATVTATNWTPTIGEGLGSPRLSTCHNIYIDDSGVAYLAGCNVNAGGMLFVDVATTPGAPALISLGDPRYSHDVYVRDNMMYSSDINDGFFSVTDVSDINNVQLLATEETPSLVTHNAWLSDDSQTLFTTDETGNAPVASYDISDLSDIKLLDEFRPTATLNRGVVPHNVHVLDDYLVISHYTDGCVIVDAARPDNLVEVGNYDTFEGPDGGFGGSWGAYPFLPSGLTLISDQSSGLFVVRPDYQRAAYLEGNVIDGSNNMGISGATLEILNTTTSELSRTTGEYKTGIATAGTYMVRAAKPGFESVELEVTVMNGEVTEQDFVLQSLSSFAFSGNVTDATTGEVLANAQVKIANNDFQFATTTNAEGNFTLNTVFAGEYQIFAGSWGYKTQLLDSRVLNETNNSVSLALEAGIEDIFSLDLGWTTTLDAFSGEWELADPPIVVTAGPGAAVTPPADVLEDIGTGCYVTGNEADLFGGVLIGGTTTLTSPAFDLTTYTNPQMSFHAWYLNVNSNDGSAPTTPDPLIVIVSNGVTTVNIDTIQSEAFGVTRWEAYEYNLSEWIELTANMKITFSINTPGQTDIVEAGIDYFQVINGEATNIFDYQLVDYQLAITPNPSATNFQVNYELPGTNTFSTVQIYNSLGQLVEQVKLTANSGSLQFGSTYATGVYFVQLTSDQGAGKALRVVKN
ncbi:MAG: choice-of-anchor B family protein [Saprospiraceae bacterium]